MTWKIISFTWDWTKKRKYNQVLNTKASKKKKKKCCDQGFFYLPPYVDLGSLPHLSPIR